MINKIEISLQKIIFGLLNSLNLFRYDTVKITNGNGEVSHTPLRAQTWYAQTPQAAQFRYLLAAFRKAKEDGFLGTDETQLLELIGVKAKIVPCSNQNFKITFPEDLVLAKQVMKDFQG